MAALLNDRIQQLNSHPETGGKSIIYVMARDQRAHDNHALLAAQAEAIRRKLPLAVVFCLYPATGFRSREQYNFMLTGLAGVEAELKANNIPLICVIGKASTVLPTVVNRFEAAAVYLDFSPLRSPMKVAADLAATLAMPVYRVDTHNILPCWVASPKLEVGARTLRPKIHKLLPDYLVEPPRLQKHPHAWPGTYMDFAGLREHMTVALKDVPKNGVTYNFPDPLTALADFLARASDYETDRNDPVRDAQSHLSPYLHFGQLSSLRIILSLAEKLPASQTAAFFEEIVIRKELSDNFCFYNPQYDQLVGASGWAQASLAKHAGGPREFLYTLEQLETAQTHDPAWNAAQLQLVRTGKIHGYMRMYWAKKVLEWSPAQARTEQLAEGHAFKERLELALSRAIGAEWALAVLVYLNDFYSIDGGDPNGYAGTLWSVAGVHDRPWVERSIFGSIRYMNYNGLKRKFDITSYQDRWNNLKNS